MKYFKSFMYFIRSICVTEDIWVKPISEEEDDLRGVKLVQI